MKKIDVIIPCYNEENHISNTLRKVSNFSRKNKSYRFLFVDDGSTDSTKMVLNDNIKKSETTRLKVLSYSKNRGKGGAIKYGVERASGDYICFLDSDLAYSLDHLDVMLENLEESDVVIGCRGLAKSDSGNTMLTRKIFGVGFNTLSRIILNIGFKDTQAGLKGFKREAAKNLFSKQTIEGFAFDVELIYLANKLGYKITEIPARVSENHSYKISKVNLIKDTIRMFFNLFQVKLNDLFGKYG